MEIFNIHIFEFLLIAGLSLVVFGPERLPEVGRFLGQQVAKFLAWQQQSPELQMLNDVRGEFEREIASLRDELVRTRQQLDISKDLSAIKDDLRPMLDLKGNLELPGAKPANGVAATEPTIAPPTSPVKQAAEAAEQAADLAAKAADVAEQAADLAADVAEAATPDPLPTIKPAAQTVTAAAQPNRLALRQPTTVLGQPGPPVGDQPLDQPATPAAEPVAEAAPTEQLTALEPVAESDERLEYLRARRGTLHDPPSPPAEYLAPGAEAGALNESEREQLLRRVQALAAELQALTAELQERRVIAPDWQAPAQPPEQETISR